MSYKPTQGPVFDDEGFPICGARVKAGVKKSHMSENGVCRRPPMPNNRCIRHGGTTRSGSLSSQFKHGLRSPVYQAQIKDPGLLDPKRPMAAQAQVVDMCADRLALRDSPKFRTRALALFRRAESAWNNSDVDALGKAMVRLGEHLENAIMEDRALADLSHHADRLHQQQIKYWAVAFSAKASFSAEEMRQSIRILIDAMKAEGLSREKSASILGRWDEELFDGRLGFVGLPKSGSLVEKETTNPAEANAAVRKIMEDAVSGGVANIPTDEEMEAEEEDLGDDGGINRSIELDLGAEGPLDLEPPDEFDIEEND